MDSVENNIQIIIKATLDICELLLALICDIIVPIFKTESYLRPSIESYVIPLRSKYRPLWYGVMEGLI